MSLGDGPVLSGRRLAARTLRERRAVESWTSAAEALGPITSGMATFVLSRGQWSMLDAIRHVLDQLGPASVSVWTWAVAAYEVEAMSRLLADGRLRSGRLIVDRSSEQRSVSTIDAWRARFGADSVRVAKTHAKIGRVWTAEHRVLLRGSCNLNHNPRFEQLDLSEGGPAFALVGDVEDALPVLPRLCGHAEAAAASGLSKAWSLGQLAAFSGAKKWVL